MVELVRQNQKVNKKIYNEKVKEIRNVLGNNPPITHVGSTAIPNMYGKNIIDILIGAKNDDEFEEMSSKLLNMGYCSGRNSKGNIYRFFANTDDETKSGDIHLHLVIVDTDRYKDFITLKNYLLQNKEEAKNYSNLKKQILKSGHNDRNEYKTIKSEYVNNLLNRAREFASKNNN